MLSRSSATAEDSSRCELRPYRPLLASNRCMHFGSLASQPVEYSRAQRLRKCPSRYLLWIVSNFCQRGDRRHQRVGFNKGAISVGGGEETGVVPEGRLAPCVPMKAPLPPTCASVVLTSTKARIRGVLAAAIPRVRSASHAVVESSDAVDQRRAICRRPCPKAPATLQDPSPMGFGRWHLPPASTPCAN